VSRVPRLLVPALPASGTVRLPEDEAAHLARVLRARPGDTVRAFDGRGREAECRVVEVARTGALVEVVRDVLAPRPAREVVLATSVPRGARMEWLVEKATEAGVASLLPLAARRSVRKEAGANEVRRWRRAAAEAAKQCGRATVPEVTDPLPMAEAIARTADCVRLVGAPGASATLVAALPARGRVALFVGPEGGFDAEETQALAEAGALPFGLGPLILRVETAAVVAVHTASA
jgi:16S rRNA (uracil1498-N3)-methyltransferase